MHDNVGFARQVCGAENTSVFPVERDKLALVRGAKEPVSDEREAVRTCRGHVKRCRDPQIRRVDDNDLRRLADVGEHDVLLGVIYRPPRPSGQRDRRDHSYIVQ